MEKLIDQEKKLLNICLVSDSFYPVIDGVISVLDNYARRLSKIANVVVVVPKYFKKDNYPVVPYKVIYCNAVSIIYNNYKLAVPSYSRQFLKTLKTFNFDIIHSHSPVGLGRFMQKYAKKNKIPYVLTLHTQFKVDFKNALKSNALTALAMARVMKSFNKADEVWTLNENGRNLIYDYGFNDGKNIIMRNGTDYKLPLNYEEKKQSINKEFNIDNNLPVFLFVGRITVTKNIIFIVDSLKILKDKGFKFKMFFIGDGPDFGMLKNHINKCQLDQDVILTGRITDKDKISNFLARSDLFLFPSTYDMSSIVQIEAASHKVPCVFIKGAVTAAGIVDNANGFLSDNSVEAFANRVSQIIGDKKLLAQVSENCYKNIYKDWDSVINLVLQRYEQIIQEFKTTK